MRVDDVIAALGLPGEALVMRRISKRLLADHGVTTSGVIEARWVAALKPATAGVPGCAEATEIQVITVTFAAGTRLERAAGPIHRAIPYPVLLLLDIAEAGLVVSLGGHGTAAQTCELGDDELTRDWLRGLAFAAQPRGDLAAVYQGWGAAVEALRAARITGVVGDETVEADGRRQALDEHARLQREIGQLRTQAQKERQLNRRIDLNLKLKRLESEFAAAADRLAGKTGSPL